MFGNPREDIHAARIPVLDVASVDVIATLIGGYFVSQIWGYSLFYTIITLFIIAIISHRMFCVRTKVDTFLFSDY